MHACPFRWELEQWLERWVVVMELEQLFWESEHELWQADSYYFLAFIAFYNPYHMVKIRRKEQGLVAIVERP